MRLGLYYTEGFVTGLLAWAVTILIGVTFIFFIPRLFPSDPVENMIGRIQSNSGQMDPAEKEALRKSLRVQFGLEGSLWTQYTSFLWKDVYKRQVKNRHNVPNRG